MLTLSRQLLSQVGISTSTRYHTGTYYYYYPPGLDQAVLHDLPFWDKSICCWLLPGFQS